MIWAAGQLKPKLLITGGFSLRSAAQHFTGWPPVLLKGTV